MKDLNELDIYELIELLDERAQRLFACECAKRVLPWHEAVSDDNRPRKMIEVAERYASGNATARDLLNAFDDATDSVWMLRSLASCSAVRLAAWAARATGHDNAKLAARYAASHVLQSVFHEASSQDRDAAWNAEREWQRRRLIELIQEA